MCEKDDISNRLEQLGETIRRHESVEASVISRIETDDIQMKSDKHWSRRILLAGPLAASILIAISLAIMIPGFRTRAAFGAAYENILTCKTFSTIQTFTPIPSDDEQVTVTKIMFMEPCYYRYENTAGPSGHHEIIIENFRTRMQLLLNESAKTASYRSTAGDCEVDPATGQLQQRQLDTSLREQLLSLAQYDNIKKTSQKLSFGSDKVLDTIESQTGTSVITTTIDKSSGLPVSISIRQPGSLWAYDPIELDAPLDTELFSMTAPDGYAIKNENDQLWTLQRKQMSAKIRYLFVLALRYAKNNDGNFPDSISGLESIAGSSEILRNVLAGPDGDNASQAIIYNPVNMQDYQGQIRVVFFENVDWSKNNYAVVGFMDGHIEVLTRKQMEPFLGD